MRPRIRLITPLLFAMFFVTSKTAQAETFADAYFRAVEAGVLEHFSLGTAGALDEKPFKARTPAEKALLAFYAKSLPTPKPAKWVIVRLPATATPPVGGVSLALANDSFLWALDIKGAKRAGFRAVSTRTGCASGCSPLVFHLRFDASGKPVALLPDPKHPLQKLGHSPFTPADIEQLSGLVRKMPQGLAGLARPADATNEVDSFPAQTWTPFRPLVVRGAAYTSYRVYEAALGAADALSLSLSEAQKRIGDAQDLLGQIYRLDDVKAARAMLARLNTLLNSSSDPKASATPRETRLVALELAAPLAAWIAAQSDLNESEAFSSLPVKVFAEQRPGAFCVFYRQLLNSERSARLLSQVLKKPERWPSCGSEADRALRWLAATRLGDSERLKELVKEFPATNPLPRLAVDNSASLSLFLDGAHRAGAADLERRTRAELMVRFPKAAQNISGKDTETQHLRSEAETQAMNEARRLLSDPADLMPSVKGLRQGKPVQLPLLGQARVYIFFAAWCPHCQETFARWVKDYGADGAFWDRLTLVATMPDGITSTADFCAKTGMAKLRCAQIIDLPAPEKADGFYDRIALNTVPRAAGTDALGRLRIPDLNIPTDNNADFGLYTERVLKVLAEKSAP